MINETLQARIIENKDWATILFVISFILIAITKSTFENRFNDFSKLIFSNKYLKMYKDSSHLMSWFNILLFFVQLISFTFFIQIFLNYLGMVSKFDGLTFLRIATLLGVFILSKFLIEKIIATTFKIEEFQEQFNLKKISYRTYIGVLILPINIILFYNNNIPIIVINLILIALLALNTLTYIKSLKLYQSLIFGKLFYFILYLCALEIAPYYFIYYWFTRS